MDLQNIETIVLQLTGYDRYAELSVSTVTEKVADFALLHRCVQLAREEIKLNCNIPGIIAEHSFTTVLNTKVYSMPNTFDIPVKAIYKSSSSQWVLGQVYLENLLQKVGDITAVGTPSVYMILGQSSDLIQLKLYDTPGTAGDTVYVYHKPVLTYLETSTDESVLMKKYPNTIIKLATAFAFQILKKSDAGFSRYYTLGYSDFSTINLREGSADINLTELPDALTRARRMGRTTI